MIKENISNIKKGANRKQSFSIRRVLAALLLIGSIPVIPLTLTGQLTPFFAAAGLLPIFRPSSLTQTSLHPRPDLIQFPSKLDDLVIAAHYDDEALAEGGFLRSEINQGKKIGVVVVTFSQGSTADQRNWYGLKRRYNWLQWRFINSIPLTPRIGSEYALQREAETTAVLDRIGVPSQNRLFLRYPGESIKQLLDKPDQPIEGSFLDPLSRHVEKYTGRELQEMLRAIILYSDPTRIITHFPDDTNSDHRAIARLVDSITAAEKPPTETWSFLVHWNTHDGAWAPPAYDSESAWLLVPPRDLFHAPLGSPTAAVEHQQSLTVPWTGDIVAWKRSLLTLYVSQVALDHRFMRDFAKRNELFWNLPKHTLIDVRFGPADATN